LELDWILKRPDDVTPLNKSMMRQQLSRVHYLVYYLSYDVDEPCVRRRSALTRRSKRVPYRFPAAQRRDRYISPRLHAQLPPQAIGYQYRDEHTKTVKVIDSGVSAPTSKIDASASRR
jgi:hypothetical protein